MGPCPIIVVTYQTCLLYTSALLAKYLDSHPEIDGLFCVNREFTKYISRILDRRGWWDRYRITAFDYPDDRRISHVRQDLSLIHL